jgi:hypothetical protein
VGKGRQRSWKGRPVTGALRGRLRRLEGEAGDGMTHEEWLGILEKGPGYEPTPGERERMRRSGEINHDWMERLK